MNVIFMGRKPAASAALRFLYQSGVNITAVVAPLPNEVADQTLFWRPLLRETAKELGLVVISDRDLYRWLENPSSRDSFNFDLNNLDAIISFLFWKRIREPLLSAARVGAFNFHPGPLPEFRACRGYNFAILEDYKQYGATVHWMAKNFDEGDIVEVRPLDIRPDETAFSLEQRTQHLLVEMFKDFVQLLLSGRPIPRKPQGAGKTATKAEMLAAARIDPNDPPAVTERRVRAFWYPPHTGATITIGTEEYTLVDKRTLRKLGECLHNKTADPF